MQDTAKNVRYSLRWSHLGIACWYMVQSVSLYGAVEAERLINVKNTIDVLQGIQSVFGNETSELPAKADEIITLVSKLYTLGYDKIENEDTWNGLFDHDFTDTNSPLFATHVFHKEEFREDYVTYCGEQCNREEIEKYLQQPQACFDNKTLAVWLSEKVREEGAKNLNEQCYGKFDLFLLLDPEGFKSLRTFIKSQKEKINQAKAVVPGLIQGTPGQSGRHVVQLDPLHILYPKYCQFVDTTEKKKQKDKRQQGRDAELILSPGDITTRSLSTTPGEEDETLPPISEPLEAMERVEQQDIDHKDNSDEGITGSPGSGVIPPPVNSTHEKSWWQRRSFLQKGLMIGGGCMVGAVGTTVVLVRKTALGKRLWEQLLGKKAATTLEPRLEKVVENIIALYRRVGLTFEERAEEQKKLIEKLSKVDREAVQEEVKKHLFASRWSDYVFFLYEHDRMDVENNVHKK